MNVKKPIAVHLDRLAAVLAAKGVDLKRTELLEAAAAAFGYHNSHECAAASKRGDLSPPSVEPICRVAISTGEALIVVRDPVTNAPYGIDETFIEQVAQEERREIFGPSPYGGLMDLRPVAEHSATTYVPASSECQVMNSDEETVRILVELKIDGPVDAGVIREGVHDAIVSHKAENGLSADDDEGMVVEVGTKVLSPRTAADVAAAHFGEQLGQIMRESGRGRIHVALIHHKHGVDVRLGTTLAGVSRQVADHARENWNEAWNNDQVQDRKERIGLPEDHDGLDDDAVETMYFAAMSVFSASEYVDYSVIDLDGDEEHPDSMESRPALHEEPFPGVPAGLYTVNASRDGHVFIETFRLEEGENEEDKGRELAANAFGINLDDYREPVLEGDGGDYDGMTDEERAEMEQQAEDQAIDERNQNFDADIDSIKIEEADFDAMLLPILRASWAAAQRLPDGDPLKNTIRRQVLDAMPKPSAD